MLGTYGIVECVHHINTRQRLARKTIKLTSKQEEENELPATAVREIAVLKSIHQENIIKFVVDEYSPVLLFSIHLISLDYIMSHSNQRLMVVVIIYVYIWNIYRLI